MGTLSGLFLAKKELVDALISTGLQVYFGEVLGKHSEVYGPIDETDITEVTSDPTVVGIFEEFDLETGFNPMHQSTIGNKLVEDADDLTVEETLIQYLANKS